MDAVAAVSSIRSVQAIFQALATLFMTAYLFPPDAKLTDGEATRTFDYIVVGAGSAGSVVASRLTENPDVTVLLVEAGDDEPVQSLLPAYMLYLKSSKWDWNYTSVPEWPHQSHKGGVEEMTRGKMLGGCSSMNYMSYVRGNPHDYNSWADVVNDPSWNYDNVLPLFKKSEDLKDDHILNSPIAKYHGTNGYMGVTRQSSKVTHKYLEAFQEIGQKVVLDTNGRDTIGYCEPLSNIADGVRQSTAYSFISPAKDRCNLVLLKNTLVTKIIFDENNNAIGIETVDEKDEKRTFNAVKEVIISAGTINSAQLLMLSGIGPKNHLEEMGIPMIADLPVGKNLQDHSPVLFMYPTENSTGPDKPVNPHEIAPMIHGYATVNATQTYPDYQTLNMILNADMALQLCAFSFTFKNYICQKFYEESIGKEIFFSLVTPLHPKSRGEILLRNRNPKEYPLTYLNTYGNKQDFEDSIIYIKDATRIVTSSYFQNLSATFLVPPDCEGLILGSEEYWSCHARCLTMSIFHYVGTCAMGSVVDSRLRVYGVGNLRVVDGSVMPTITSGNPNVPIIMIGEKAAEMIKEDNGKNC